MNIWITVTERFGVRHVALFDMDRCEPGCLPARVGRTSYIGTLPTEAVIKDSLEAHFGKCDRTLRRGDVKNLWISEW